MAFMNKIPDKSSFLFLFTNLVIVAISLWWLNVKNVQSGLIYFTMLILSVVFYLLAVSTSHFEAIKQPLKELYNVSLENSIFTYLIGFGGALLIGTILKAVSNFNISSFSIPLLGNNLLSGINQSFSAVEVGESMAWKLFIIVFTAGILEEFAFLFGSQVISLIVARLFNKVAFDGKRGLYFEMGLSFFIGASLFMGAHALNQTYIGFMFFFAFFFRMVSLILVYATKIPILTNYYFWVGYHQANNLIFLIVAEGSVNVFNGFISWFGLFFAGFFIFYTYFLIRNWDKVKLRKEAQEG